MLSAKIKKDIAKKIQNKNIILFLDYDGTLVKIAKTPDLAVIPKSTQKLLKELKSNRHFIVSIISGRSIKNTKKMVGIQGLIYAGNHGLEISGPKFKHAIKIKFNKYIEDTKNYFKKELSAIQGILVEDKGHTLSIHYRLASQSDSEKAKEIVFKIFSPFEKKKLVKITEGKKVIEIRPPINWNKGNAVNWILKKIRKNSKAKNFIPIYIGDDKTDEDAFEELRGKGLTFYVGKNCESCAQYRLQDTKQVLMFLKFLLVMKRD